MKKKNLAKYIQIIDGIKERFPNATVHLDELIKEMTHDYDTIIERELDRQFKLRKEDATNLVETDEYANLAKMEVKDFIIIKPMERNMYRRVRNAIKVFYPGRSYTMRYIKAVGICVTRVA